MWLFKDTVNTAIYPETKSKVIVNNLVYFSFLVRWSNKIWMLNPWNNKPHIFLHGTTGHELYQNTIEWFPQMFTRYGDLSTQLIANKWLSVNCSDQRSRRIDLKEWKILMDSKLSFGWSLQNISGNH